MTLKTEDTRQQMLNLLDVTRCETRSLLSSLDPDRIIHTDERLWSVRDIIGHLGVWNMEAVRSLKAHAEGGEYSCIPSEAEYYDYNGPTADERRAWTMDQVWAEYDSAHEQLYKLVSSMPDEKWESSMLYPWNARGTPARLVKVMMEHEKVEHCDLVIKVTTEDNGTGVVTRLA